MSPDEFRRHGHQVIDWIADYWSSLADRPVLSQVAPGDVRAAVPSSPPASGESFDAVLADLDTVVLPGITHWQHPRFFAYFPANSAPAAVLADLVSSGLGAQGMIWSTSPAATELEQVVLDWFAELLDLGSAFRNADGVGGGVIQDTASTATMTALLAALHRASGGTARDVGVQDGRRYAVYASSQAHSSLVKAAMMTGIGEHNVRLIDVDPESQAMLPEALEAAVRADVEAGIIPTMVLSAVGTTSTGAVDPTRAIAQIATMHGIWLHVDAAWAGVAAICPEHRDVLDGVAEYADSLVVNPHKWLLTTFDCSTFWVRDRSALTGALSILPEYLRNAATESGEVVDYRDWHPQLGRRFRALKLWSVFRTYGVEGLRAHIRSGVTLAQRFEELVQADPRFSLVVPRSLGLVTFAVGDDELTMAVMDEVNRSGTAYLTHTKVNGRAAMRLAVGGVWTQPEDVDTTWQAIQTATDSLLGGRAVRER
ncbi:aspartate aminotransferase family protein [Epidermidibacterium keratini]|uniref:Aspartate aminotransferase family protein n=1 Tax=Epidermidibacterium keratini TaxID=1891644 RepID=A0A7L4YSZ5_9ACTN|nr:aspartate aminotransferase family protein [Epidermidibacterium keratini]